MKPDKRALKVERLLTSARLQDLQVLLLDGQAARVHQIKTVIENLGSGTYLIGTGPYTQGVFSLMTDEVIIGRYATPLEKSKDVPVDIFVNDAVTLTPREVSRAHCYIYRKESGNGSFDYWVVDRGSTCGTYVNGDKLSAPASASQDDLALASKPLIDGDVISLGPSHVNTFLFCNL